MPSLSPYRSDLDYAYAPGMFPAMECLLHRPDKARRVLLHSKSAGTEGAARLIELAEKLHVRVEEADRALGRISGKENCFAAAVFGKFDDALAEDRPHVVLHNPSDCGNVGTILRTALGFGVEDVALIRPCVDVFDPRVVRASMGSLFQLRIHTYDDFEDYRRDYPAHMLYPFMLDGSRSLPEVLAGALPPRWTLIFGNEGSGLPPAFSQMGQPVRIPSNERIDSLNLSIAAAIGIYGFTRR
ncbi:MAG: TrmH family RNA methyltransferase [Clostridiales bacterium]|nr:TrmH family RNA methyltransferase [Clostridiales bacterium]